MFNFNFFNKKTIKEEDIKKNEQLPKDIEKLSKVTFSEKGMPGKLKNPFYHSTEEKEEHERLNENDLKGYLRKYVSVEDVSSGDEWERYGEEPEETEEEPELEEREEIKEVLEPSLTEEEIKQRIWAQYLKNEELKNEIENKREEIFNKIKNPSINIEHKQKKISPREEKKIIKAMSPVKRIALDDVKQRIRNGYKSKDSENLKTMTDNKKQKMHREKIAKFLDSKEGQDRIL